MNLNLTVNGKTYSAEIADPNADPMTITVDGLKFSVSANGVAPAAAASAVGGGETVTAPIPGTIQDVLVKPGQSVKAGDVLFVLEAMKMKNNIVAETDGTVASVEVSKGDSVTHGQVLCVYAGGAAPASAAAGETVTAPIPGTIQDILVKPGQSVKAGDVLFVLEAMKMKNNIVAEHDAVVASVDVSKGDSVTHGQVLLSYAG